MAIGSLSQTGGNERVEIIKAVFAGIKELILATAALATIWIQAQNSGKLDSAAAKTEVVEAKLEKTTAEHDQKLEAIESSAKTAAVAADASAKSWRAYTTKDPEDMDVAAKALEATERPK